VPNSLSDPEGQKTEESWFNVAAFERVPAGAVGNAGRNTVRGPGYATFDMSVQRRIAFTNRIGASLRWDVFNLFDRA
jgi:lipoprotein signal peptidase